MPCADLGIVHRINCFYEHAGFVSHLTQQNYYYYYTVFQKRKSPNSRW